MSELQVASIRTEVAAPAALVWDVLVDLDKYALWNPLNRRRPWPLRYNGKNVLVVGMGPAGYTLAHHLLNKASG